MSDRLNEGSLPPWQMGCPICIILLIWVQGLAQYGLVDLGDSGELGIFPVEFGDGTTDSKQGERFISAKTV